MTRRGSSALAVVALATLVGCSRSADSGREARPSAVEVSISPAMPMPDEGDYANLPQDRYWFIHPRVAVRLRRNCESVRVTTRVAGFTDRSGKRRTWADNLSGDLSPEGTQRAGTVLREWAGAYSGWGATLRLRAEATCSDGGKRVASAAATRWFDLPSGPCSEARFRVFESSRAERRGNRGWEPLAPDDTLAAGDEVRVGRGGSVVAGAPECNAFSSMLTAGAYRIGSYDPASRGLQFHGERMSSVGDSHAGGFTVDGRLEVYPLDIICKECVPQPSAYEVRSQGRSRSTVRVSSGAVLASTVAGRTIRVRAGHQADAVCAPRCRLTRRLFQPREPWSTPPDSSGRFVGRLSSPSGRPPPVARLAPPNASARIQRLAGEPEQIFVAWYRELRARGGSASGDFQRQNGVLIWERSRRARRDEWRVVYGRRFPGTEPPVAAQYHDATGDGHLDVLVSQRSGSGGCGPRILLGTVRGRVRTLFRRWTCETYERLERGLLVIDEPVGPCPHRAGGAHCFGGNRHVVKRWNGEALETISSTVRCVLPRLDPARECRARR